MAAELTDIQSNILNYVVKHWNEAGMPPTLAEIAEHFGYKNRATVQQHLKALEKKGYIRRNPKLARGIELVAEESITQVKPLLGEVAAGNPLAIYPDAIDTVELPMVAKMPRNSFLLRVKGDSLKDAYIFSGDVVIVNPDLLPKDGQFVVAVLDDSAVVKRFFKKSDVIELHSENPEYEPIVVKHGYLSFKVVGVVIGVYRSMDTYRN